MKEPAAVPGSRSRGTCSVKPERPPLQEPVEVVDEAALQVWPDLPVEEEPVVLQHLHGEVAAHPDAPAAVLQQPGQELLDARVLAPGEHHPPAVTDARDRKSTRLNSSHGYI